jgi:hypothetical protein
MRSQIKEQKNAQDEPNQKKQAVEALNNLYEGGAIMMRESLFAQQSLSNTHTLELLLAHTNSGTSRPHNARVSSAESSSGQRTMKSVMTILRNSIPTFTPGTSFEDVNNMGLIDMIELCLCQLDGEGGTLREICKGKPLPLDKASAIIDAYMLDQE